MLQPRSKRSEGLGKLKTVESCKDDIKNVAYLRLFLNHARKRVLMMEISAYLPTTAKVILDFRLTAREVRGTNNEFCSYAGRINSLAAAGTGLIMLVTCPIFIVLALCESKVCIGWKIVDFVASLALGVLFSIALIMRGLFGAVFHPGIVFKSRDASLNAGLAP